MSKSNIVVFGRMVRHTIKPIEKGQYEGTNAGDVLVEIDNSYEYQGEHKDVKDLVPFGVFGKSADKVLNEFQPGDEMKITMTLKGSEYNGRQYVKLRVAFVNHAGAGAAAGGGQGGGAPADEEENPF